MNWITGFKKVTHAVALAGTAGLAWAFSSQGQEVIGGIIKAYPKTAAVTTILGFLSVLLHSPKS